MPASHDQRTVSGEAAAYAESFAGSSPELEKELRRLVRLWQDDADRAAFSEDKRPPWWPPNATVTGIPSLADPARVSAFRNKSKTVRWSKDSMLALVALAFDSFRAERNLDLSSPNAGVSLSPPTSPTAPASPTLVQTTPGHSPSSSLATPGSPAHPAMRRAKLACAELDAELQRRLAALDTLVETAVNKLRAVYSVQMLKLPKRVKKMPLTRFLDSFEGNTDLFYLAAIRQQVHNTLTNHDDAKENDPVPRTARRARARQIAVDIASQPQSATRKRVAATRASKRIAEQSGATPAHQTRRNRLEPPMSTARKMRPGEIALSKNGSPLHVERPRLPMNQLPATRANRKGTKPDITLGLQLRDGEELSIDSLGPQDQDIAKEVMATLEGHLKKLQAQMSLPLV